MQDDKVRTYGGGAFVVLIGALTAYFARGYDIGTLQKIGPGFFPFYLGIILVLIGVLLVLAAGRGSEARESDVPSLPGAGKIKPDWRGWGFIVGGMAVFIVLAEFAGLVAASFFCVFITALADRSTTLKSAGILAFCLTIVSVALFSKLLGISIPLVRGM